MKTVKDYIHEATVELQQKTLRDIQMETAMKWTGRAWAAKMLQRPAMEVTEYAHEALEHAALTGDPKFVIDVMTALRDL